MLPCASENSELAAHLAWLRKETAQALKVRLDQAEKEGQLGKSTKTAVCAGFLHVVVSGMSVAARDGATEAELLRYAAIAVSAIDPLTAEDQC